MDQTNKSPAADPFGSDFKFLRLSYGGTLQWLQRNQPPVDASDRVILKPLFDRCIIRVSEMLISLQSTEGFPFIHTETQKRLKQEIDGIQYWIHPDYEKPLSDEQLELYALKLDLCGVGLRDGLAMLKKAQRPSPGANIQIARALVVKAAEIELQDPQLSWGKIAHRVGISRTQSGSLRKSVKKLRTFCSEWAIDIPKPRRKKSK